LGQKNETDIPALFLFWTYSDSSSSRTSKKRGASLDWRSSLLEILTGYFLEIDPGLNLGDASIEGIPEKIQYLLDSRGEGSRESVSLRIVQPQGAVKVTRGRFETIQFRASLNQLVALFDHQHQVLNLVDPVHHGHFPDHVFGFFGQHF
jgi:hypothetical protein